MSSLIGSMAFCCLLLPACSFHWSTTDWLHVLVLSLPVWDLLYRKCKWLILGQIQVLTRFRKIYLTTCHRQTIYKQPRLQMVKPRSQLPPWACYRLFLASSQLFSKSDLGGCSTSKSLLLPCTSQSILWLMNLEATSILSTSRFSTIIPWLLWLGELIKHGLCLIEGSGGQGRHWGYYRLLMSA